MRSDGGHDHLSDDRGGRDPAPTWWVPSSAGVELAVHRLADAPGADGAAPLLLAHATGFHGLVWGPMVEHLPGHLAVAPDLRGHGQSRVRAGLSYDWDGFADDVLAVVDGLGLVRPVGIGHSKGGAALLRAEMRRPGTFRAIWCFEPIVFPPEIATGRKEGNPLAEGALRRRATFPSHEAAVTNYAAKPPLGAFDPAALEAYVRGGFERQPDGSVSLRCRPEVEAEVYRMGTAHDTFVHLGEITCPVVVAVGTDGPGSPAAIGPRVAAALPLGRLHRFDHVGHFGPLEDPAGMAADVAELVGAAAT